MSRPAPPSITVYVYGASTRTMMPFDQSDGNSPAPEGTLMLSPVNWYADAETLFVRVVAVVSSSPADPLELAPTSGTLNQFKCALSADRSAPG
ncbi:hypothetical protein D3C78_771840 [compost metagenome]